jgi:cysteine synthase B
MELYHSLRLSELQKGVNSLAMELHLSSKKNSGPMEYPMPEPLARQLGTRDPFLETIGGTPMLEISKVKPPEIKARIFAKAEHFNPGGSIKDRPALSMILRALSRGDLDSNTVLVDATSGNTGIAYAMIGSRLGLHVKIFIPANASPGRIKTLRAYGAELVLTDPTAGSDGAILGVRAFLEENQEQCYYPDQYTNPDNPLAHALSTGPEILAQTSGRVTHFLAGVGTSGTLMGVGAYLKDQSPRVQLIGMQPDLPFHGLEGLKHMETAIVPGIYRPEILDRTIRVDTESAQQMSRDLARKEGLLVGISAGANICAAIRLARELELDESATVVTVLCDTGSRYLSESFWTQ